MKRPTKVSALSKIGIIQASLGPEHGAGVTGTFNKNCTELLEINEKNKASGYLYVWGSGEYGCLGRGDHTTLVSII